MRDMDEFEATVYSLGEHIVDGIGRDHVALVEVRADDRLGTADVEIGLRANTWEEQERAIDRMVDVRGMFLGEVSIDYHFVDLSEDARSAAREPRLCVTA